MLSKKEISIINSRIDLYNRFHDKAHEKFLLASSGQEFPDEDVVSLFLESFMCDVASNALSILLEELLENRRKYA